MGYGALLCAANLRRKLVKKKASIGSLLFFNAGFSFSQLRFFIFAAIVRQYKKPHAEWICLHHLKKT